MEGVNSPEPHTLDVVIERIETAVMLQDYIGLLSTIYSQDYLDTLQVAEHLDAERHKQTDPYVRQLWSDGLDRYLKTLDAQEVDDDATHRLQRILVDWSFDDIIERL